ncbi:MAG: hypothetical protein ACI4MM_11165 [Candidatus Ventricola sp.]
MSAFFGASDRGAGEGLFSFAGFSAFISSRAASAACARSNSSKACSCAAARLRLRGAGVSFLCSSKSSTSFQTFLSFPIIQDYSIFLNPIFTKSWYEKRFLSVALSVLNHKLKAKPSAHLRRQRKDE